MVAYLIGDLNKTLQLRGPILNYVQFIFVLDNVDSSFGEV